MWGVEDDWKHEGDDYVNVTKSDKNGHFEVTIRTKEASCLVALKDEVGHNALVNELSRFPRGGSGNNLTILSRH